MKKKIKGLKRDIRLNQQTGKLDKSFSSDDGIVIVNEVEDTIQIKEDNDRWKFVKTVPCLGQFDNLEVVDSKTKIFNKAEFNCGIDLEISLSVAPKLHQHDIRRLTNPNVPDLQVNPVFEDFGEFSCGIKFNITHRTQAKILNKNQVEDNDAKELENLAEINNELAKNYHFVSNVLNEKNLKNYRATFTRMSKYIEENIANELERVVNRLILEFYASGEKGDEREENISIILNEEDKELRKRLSTAKGRIPTKLRTNYESEKEKFIEKCLKVFKLIEERKGRLNRHQLAKEIFVRTDNPLQSLRRTLKNLDLSFEEILQKYGEQKPF